MRRTAVFAIVVVALVSTRGSVRPDAQVPRTFEADVVLELVNGVCAPTEPALLNGKFGQTVTWKIVNRGCGDQYVSIHRFKNKDRSASELSPIHPASLDVGPIARGERYDAAATINRHVTAVEHYSYQICVGDMPQDAKKCIGADPDLDVWPTG